MQDSPNSPKRLHVLIPAGGTGSRAGGEQPKQYREIGGVSMLARTVGAFLQVPGVTRVLVVVSPRDQRAEHALGAMADDARVRVARCAGDLRCITVLNGLSDLMAAGEAGLADWVLVHDAARCLVTPQMVQNLVEACLDDPVGGLLAMPLADTLKQGDGHHVRETLPRPDKWLAQTPQMFRVGVLRDALIAAGDVVTDESSAIEALGLHPRLVQGSALNFKVTWPEDFGLAQAVIDARSRQALEVTS